jgi:hypothetical protein
MFHLVDIHVLWGAWRKIAQFEEQWIKAHTNILVACCGQQTRRLSIFCHVSLSTIVIISWPMNEPPPQYIIYDIAEETPQFYLFEDTWCVNSSNIKTNMKRMNAIIISL